MTKIAHNLVAKTAKEIAFEVYEALATSDKFYQAWPNQKVFVRKCWSQFLGDARKALARMLQPDPGSDPLHPTYKYSEHIRNEVFEALCLEGEFKGTQH